MLRVMLFDRYDQPLGELSENDVFEIVRTEEVNGTHSLEITTTRVLRQGWRILTCDARGKWREHVVYGTDDLHDAGYVPFGTYYCVWSVQPDLQGTRTSHMPGTQTPTTAALALDDALDGTSRWVRGTVTNTNTGGASMYDTDGWDAIATLVGEWGGEVDTTIEVGSSGVTARKVDLYSKQGDQSAKRRFDFGADIKSIRRIVPDGPIYCRITPRGKGDETDTGGYGRKITIASVNGGLDYLENSAMTDLAKLPDGNGGWEYPTVEVENADCETPAELKAWALTVLDDYTVPQITYEVDALQIAREGVDMQGLSLGDAVQVVDRKFGDGIRLTGRVVAMKVNMLNEADAQITIGRLRDGLAGMFGSIGAQVSQLTETVMQMNGGSMSTAEYLSRLLDRLNTEINATGGYTYITEGEGIRTYDKAVTDPLVGSEADAVVEVKGGTIRIANTKTAQGAWEWKTVFTSGHIAANVVTAANITTGYIGSSGDTFIDLDNHTVQLGKSNGPHTVINDNGMNIYRTSTSLAYFGLESSVGIARVGDSSAGNVVMSSDGYVDVRHGSTSLAHFGWGRVYNTYGSSINGCYTRLGTMKESSVIGEWSFASGWENLASSFASVALGRDNIASSGSGACIGYGLRHGPSSGEGCVAVGMYNAYDSSTMGGDGAQFVVGIGASNNGRANALVVARAGVYVSYLECTGYIKAYGYHTTSDKRLKEHVSYLAEDACEFVRKLKPALFMTNGERHLGFYAQDVEDADEWGSVTAGEGNIDKDIGYAPHVLDYQALIAPLVAYAQSLEERIAQLEARVTELEAANGLA